MKSSVLPLAVALLAGGCAPALRKPPTLDELAGTRLARRAPEEAAPLLDAAARAFDDRTLESVRRAVLVALEAAAADGESIDGLIAAVRAGVWLAGHAETEQAREKAATAAVQASQLCGMRQPEDAVCDYWLGVALGVQARERRSTALDALPQIVELLERAVVEVPGIEHGGPHRVLALVLVRSPGWPRGPGDPDLGLEHARSAVAIDPEYPPNILCLAEALEALDEDEEAAAARERGLGAARRWLDAGHPEAADWIEGE